MTAVTSSNIAEIGYDDVEETLTVVFTSGSIYAYFKVPYTVYLSLLEAKSVGSFFYHNVRSVYQCVKR